MSARIAIAIVGIIAGIIIGYLLWHSEPVDPGPPETVVVYRDRPSDLDQDEATAPGVVTVYRERIDTVDVCLGLPPELAPRPQQGLVFAPLPDVPRRYPFLILPFAAGGQPAVSVYRSRTDITTYDPETARRVDLSYAHPAPPRFSLHGSISAWAVPSVAKGADVAVSASLDRWTARIGYGPVWEGGSLRWVPTVRVEGRLF